MKISFNLNIKLILIILVIVAIFGFNFLTWRKAVKAERNSQAVLNYINIQIQKGIFPAPPAPPPPPVKEKKPEEKKGEK